MTMSITLAVLAIAQTAAPATGQAPWQVPPAAAATPQAVIAPAPPRAVIISPPTESVLRAGTEVPLIMAESITTNGKKIRVG